MITKTTQVDVITIVYPENADKSVVQYRIATTVRDGEEVLTETYHRESLSRVDFEALSVDRQQELPAIVQAYCRFVWGD